MMYVFSVLSHFFFLLSRLSFLYIPLFIYCKFEAYYLLIFFTSKQPLYNIFTSWYTASYIEESEIVLENLKSLQPLKCLYTPE